MDKLLKLRADTEEMNVFKKSAMPSAADTNELNHVLFVEGLSKVTPTLVLNNLFEKHAGFKEVRHIVERQVAFVEFETEQ